MEIATRMQFHYTGSRLKNTPTFLGNDSLGMG